MKREDDVWETPHVRLKHQIEFSREIGAIAWSPTEDLVAVGGTDGWIKLVNPGDGSCTYLGEHGGAVRALVFSPDGTWLTSSGGHGRLLTWHLGQRALHRRVPESSGETTTFAFRCGGRRVVTGVDSGLVAHWDWQSGRLLSILDSGRGFVSSIASSPTTDAVAAGGTQDVTLWRLVTDQLGTDIAGIVLAGHTKEVNALSFSPDGRLLVSASSDASMIVWDAQTGELLRVLFRHSTPVRAIAFSRDGRLLASKSSGGRILLSRCEDWHELDSTLEDSTTLIASIAFGPHYQLATYGPRQRSLRIWDIDPEILAMGKSTATRYCNAKVVLLGDSGVGKSALAAALMGEAFAPTESTHGRKVYELSASSVDVGAGVEEVREVVLWDLAGQPGYRLIHQMHLHDANVAAIVFDSRSDTDPFSGVRYWDRALRQAQRLLGPNSSPIRKLLVAARTDRGGLNAGKEQMALLCAEIGVEFCIATSAKTGAGIDGLSEAILSAIDWSSLPKLESSKLLGDTAELLSKKREGGEWLSMLETLWKAFRERPAASNVSSEDRMQFVACVNRLESLGLVRQLTFGGYVLLAPELLDGYASAIVEAARDEPDGLGSIAEDDVRTANFRIPSEARLGDPATEQILLLGTIEVLLRSEIALREHTGEGTMLVFPAQSTRSEAAVTAQVSAAVRIAFEGSAPSIYTTLAVRLCRSGVFTRTALWRDGLQLRDEGGALCGIRLRRSPDEVGGEIEVFCMPNASEITRRQLARFVESHVARRCVANTLKVLHGCVCRSCGETIPDRVVELRLAKGWKTLRCPVCETENELAQVREEQRSPPDIRVMDRNADRERDGASAATTLEGKRVVAEWDTFLCYNSRDRDEVTQIGESLKALGIRPWLDEWELQGGDRWMKIIERDLLHIRSACVFVGGEGLGIWQDAELEALLHEFQRRERVIIPVILRSAAGEPDLPLFLQGRITIDFRAHADAVQRLQLGIMTPRNPGAARAARPGRPVPGRPVPG